MKFLPAKSSIKPKLFTNPLKTDYSVILDQKVICILTATTKHKRKRN